MSKKITKKQLKDKIFDNEELMKNFLKQEMILAFDDFQKKLQKIKENFSKKLKK